VSQGKASYAISTHRWDRDATRALSARALRSAWRAIEHNPSAGCPKNVIDFLKNELTIECAGPGACQVA